MTTDAPRPSLFVRYVAWNATGPTACGTDLDEIAAIAAGVRRARRWSWRTFWRRPEPESDADLRQRVSAALREEIRADPAFPWRYGI